MNLSELLEKQRKVEERARKLANQSQISRAEDEELDDLLGQNKRLKIQIEEAREGRGSGRSTDFDVAGSAGEIRSAALRTLEASGKHLAPAQLDNVDSLIRSRNENLDGLQIARRVNITESEAYRSAFMKAMTQPKPAFDAAETRAINAFQEFRAMAEGTGSEGGYGIPVLIDPTIILSSGALDSPVLKICRIVTITTDAWKGVSAPGVAWQYSAEAAVVTDGTPAFAQPNIPVYKADGWLPYTIEVEQDYPGFAEEMSTILKQGYTDLLSPALCTGSGSNQPTGVFTAMENVTTSPAHVTVTTAGTLSAIDVRTAWKSVPELFRSRSQWLMHIEVQNLIQAFGNNLALADFSTNIASDGTAVLEGRPVNITDYAPQFTNTTGTESVLVVGDFSNFVFVQRAGMTLELVPTIFDQATARPVGMRGWYAMARHGAGLSNANGLRLLSNN